MSRIVTAALRRRRQLGPFVARAGLSTAAEDLGRVPGTLCVDQQHASIGAPPKALKIPSSTIAARLHAPRSLLPESLGIRHLPAVQKRSYATESSSAALEAGDTEAAGPEEAGGQGGAEEDQRDIRTQLLDAALAHVAAYGWSDASLRAAASDLGLSQASAGMLDRGAAELIEHHVRRLNAQFKADFKQRLEEDAELRESRTPDRIFAALKMRMEMNQPYMGLWPQALAIMGQPANTLPAATVLGELVDDIWYLVGDKSVDSSWYTKRGLLAGVYVSTDLYMLTDTSPGYHDTWEALRRRLDEIQSAGGAVREVSKVMDNILKNVPFPIPR